MGNYLLRPSDRSCGSQLIGWLPLIEYLGPTGSPGLTSGAGAGTPWCRSGEGQKRVEFRGCNRIGSAFHLPRGCEDDADERPGVVDECRARVARIDCGSDLERVALRRAGAVDVGDARPHLADEPERSRIEARGREPEHPAFPARFGLPGHERLSREALDL